MASKNEQAVIDRLLDRATLNRLCEIADMLGMATPPTLARDVIKPRNTAAHSGVSPSKEVATEAINTAEKLVASICPMRL